MTHDLTAREINMLDCLLEGLENKEIAIRLQITEATVKVHMRGLFNKLGVKNRVQAALWWERQHVTRPPVDVAAVRRALQAAIADAGNALARLSAGAA